MRQVVLWLPQGRLGNLLFQAQALRALHPGALVIFFPSELDDTFVLPSNFVRVPWPRKWRRYGARLWIILLSQLATRGIAGLTEPQRVPLGWGESGEQREVISRPGRFRWLTTFRGFHQDADLAMSIPPPKLKQDVRDRAERELRTVAPDAPRVAVHIRLSDYADWVVLGNRGGAQLPVSYYRQAMRDIDARVPGATFVLFSDDPARARLLLADGEPALRLVFAPDAPAPLHLAMMALCDHAVLSASTFAWWAAALHRAGAKIVVAPRYWAGFRRRLWYPPLIFTGGFTYLPVAESDESTDPL